MQLLFPPTSCSYPGPSSSSPSPDQWVPGCLGPTGLHQLAVWQGILLVAEVPHWEEENTNAQAQE